MTGGQRFSERAMMRSVRNSPKGACALLLASSLCCGSPASGNDSKGWACEPITMWVMPDVSPTQGSDTLEACIKTPTRLKTSTSVSVQLVIQNRQSKGATIALGGRPPTARFELMGRAGLASYQLANEQPG
jgi:hypothetical protein